MQSKFVTGSWRHLIVEIDDTLFNWFQNHHTWFFNQIFINITALGSTTILLLLSIVVLLYYWITGCGHKIMTAILCIVVTFGIVGTIKYSVGRERPVPTDPVIQTPLSSSFPSGHAAMSMAVLLILALAANTWLTRSKWYWALCAIFLSLLMGTSRFYFGVHYFSDVLAGWGIGIVSACIYLLLRVKK